MNRHEQLTEEQELARRHGHEGAVEREEIVATAQGDGDPAGDEPPTDDSARAE